MITVQVKVHMNYPTLSSVNSSLHLQPTGTIDEEYMTSATTNPIFRKFEFSAYSGGEKPYSERMNLSGILHKVAILLVVFATSAVWSWTRVSALRQGNAKGALFLFLSSALGAWLLVWLTVYKKKSSPFTAPAYALLQGLVMGVVSAGFDKRYPGIAIQAVGLTIAMSLSLLIAYGSGLIRVTEGFHRRLMAAMAGVVLYYVANFGLALMGIRTLSALAIGVPGIVINAVIVIIAGLNLVSDFDFAAQCSKISLPTYMEWYAAFGLILSLVWLYIEMLRLLTKVRRTQEST